MANDPEESRESPSLEWIHRIREDHYRKTENLPLESWLPVANPQATLAACEGLGLKVRLAGATPKRNARAEES
jgi:hypothetical protein